jgi:hypothetical protein
MRWTAEFARETGLTPFANREQTTGADMTNPTKQLGRVLLICAPALLLAACAQPEAAGPTAAQAMAAAQAAQQTANQALQTAQQAETDAQAARTAASSMYQRSLHK